MYVIALKIANIVRDVIRMLLQFTQNQSDDVDLVGGRLLSGHVLYTFIKVKRIQYSF